MKKTWVIMGFILFALFIIGMIYLAQKEQSAPTAIEQAFLPYAQELGLDQEQFITAMKSDSVKDAITKDRSAGNALQVDATPTFFINGNRETFRSPEELETIIKKYQQKKDIQTIPTGAHYKGADKPTVLITEYSDFQCPACGQYAPIVKSVLEAHQSDTALIYKHFPLTSLHPMALPAARAAEAAAQQGKFWEMHDLLFAHQKDWQ